MYCNTFVLWPFLAGSRLKHKAGSRRSSVLDTMEKAREAMIKQVGKVLSCLHKPIRSGGPKNSQQGKENHKLLTTNKCQTEKQTAA